MMNFFGANASRCPRIIYAINLLYLKPFDWLPYKTREELGLEKEGNYGSIC